MSRNIELPLQTKGYNETHPFTTPAKTTVQGSNGGTTNTTQTVTARWLQLARGKKCAVVLTTFSHACEKLSFKVVH